jgi:hypothetical protein
LKKLVSPRGKFPTFGGVASKGLDDIAAGAAPPLKEQVLEEACDLALRVECPGERAELLAVLAPRHDRWFTEKAFRAALRILEPQAFANAMKSLAPFLDERSLEQAIGAARKIGRSDSPRYRAVTLAALAEYLDEPLKTQLRAGHRWGEQSMRRTGRGSGLPVRGVAKSWPVVTPYAG